MNEKGFLPLTTIGIILIVLTAGMISYFEWNNHQNKLDSINKSSTSSILTQIESKRNDIKYQAQKSLYKAVWKVSKNSDNYGGKENQKRCIENISTSLFKKKLSLMKKDNNTSAKAKLRLENDNISLSIEKDEKGYVLAAISLPENSNIFRALPDNSLRISQSSENLNTAIDCRFFLLQNQMNQFKNESNTIPRRWKYAEYATAYWQAWVNGKVNLSKKRSKMFFKLALASHEIEKFGSTDYRALASDFLNMIDVYKELKNQKTDSFTNSQKEEKIEKLKNKINEARRKIKNSKKELKLANSELKKIIQFQPENLQKELDKIKILRKKRSRIKKEHLEEKFEKICQNFNASYSYPEKQIDKALQNIKKSEKLAKKAKNMLLKEIKLLKKESDDPVIQQLYKNFTKKNPSPGIALQIKNGTKSVTENIATIRKKTLEMKELFQPYSKFSEYFPSSYRADLSQALDQENDKHVEQIISDSFYSARRTLNEFKNKLEIDKKKTDSIFLQIQKKIRYQNKEPEANWKKSYIKYPKPDENDLKKRKEKVVKKIVLSRKNATLQGIEKVLTRTKLQLDRLNRLVGEFEKKQSNLERFNIDDNLKTLLRKSKNFRTIKQLSREKSYELSPPRPLKQNPGISVYHKAKIENVKIDREDPLGLLHKSAPPTPIYLWFIDTTIYWAMWNMKIHLKKPFIEEIFDYKNQTIPRPMVKESNEYIHKALPYRSEIQNRKFQFRLLVFSLRNFKIST